MSRYGRHATEHVTLQTSTHFFHHSTPIKNALQTSPFRLSTTTTTLPVHLGTRGNERGGESRRNTLYMYIISQRRKFPSYTPRQSPDLCRQEHLGPSSPPPRGLQHPSQRRRHMGPCPGQCVTRVHAFRLVALDIFDTRVFPDEKCVELTVVPVVGRK